MESRKRAYLKKAGLDAERDREAIAELSPDLWSLSRSVRGVFALHNLLLSLGSLVMCVGAGMQMLARTGTNHTLPLFSFPRNSCFLVLRLLSATHRERG